MSEKHCYSRTQLFWLVTLRVLIGWYFLYEGLSKALAPNWTSFGYLMDSKGIFAPVFTWLTENTVILGIVDMLNMYGLIIIGLCFILGAFVRIASIGAIVMLLLYYLSHPPIIDANYLIRPEGSYLWVDKNLIMLCAIFVQIYFPSSGQIGFDRFICKKHKIRK